jgi:Sec-independent protein secretion pathway component TatC
MLAVPMCLLFELGLLCARFVVQKETASEVVAD